MNIEANNSGPGIEGLDYVDDTREGFMRDVESLVGGAGIALFGAGVLTGRKGVRGTGIALLGVATAIDYLSSRGGFGEDVEKPWSY